MLDTMNAAANAAAANWLWQLYAPRHAALDSEDTYHRAHAPRGQGNLVPLFSITAAFVLVLLGLNLLPL